MPPKSELDQYADAILDAVLQADASDDGYLPLDVCEFIDITAGLAGPMDATEESTPEAEPARYRRASRDVPAEDIEEAVERIRFGRAFGQAWQYAGWDRKQSKTGGTVWVSQTNPKDRRYQENEPGTRATKKTPAAGQPTEPPADPVTKAKTTLAGLNTADITDETVKATLRELTSMSKEQMHALREQLNIPEKGLKSASKSVLGQRIFDHVTGKTPVQPEKKPKAGKVKPAKEVAPTADQVFSTIEEIRSGGGDVPVDDVMVDLIKMNMGELRILRDKLGEKGGRSADQVREKIKGALQKTPEKKPAASLDSLLAGDHFLSLDDLAKQTDMSKGDVVKQLQPLMDGGRLEDGMAGEEPGYRLRKEYPAQPEQQASGKKDLGLYDKPQFDKLTEDNLFDAITYEYLTNGKTRNGMVAISDIRDQFPKANRQQFDDAMLSLYRQKKLRLTPSGGDHPGGIPGVGETLAYAEFPSGSSSGVLGSLPPDAERARQRLNSRYVSPSSVQESLDGIEKAIGRLAGSGERLIPIWKIRDEAPGSNHLAFDEAMTKLWRDKKARLVPMADPQGVSQEELTKGVAGVGETLFWVEPINQTGGEMEKPTPPASAPVTSLEKPAQPAAQPSAQRVIPNKDAASAASAKPMPGAGRVDKPAPAQTADPADSVYKELSESPVMFLGDLQQKFPGLTDDQFEQGMIKLLDAGKVNVHKDMNEGALGNQPYTRRIEGELYSSLMANPGLTADDLRKAFGRTAKPSAPKASPSTSNPKQSIFRGMLAAERGVAEGVPVEIAGLRRRIGMSKEDFDKQILQMADNGQIFLEAHDNPGSLTPEQRNNLVEDPDTGKFYLYASLADGAENSPDFQAAKKPASASPSGRVIPGRQKHPAKPAAPSAPTPEQSQAVMSAAQTLAAKSSNFVSLADLKRALPPMSMEQFHATVNQLRQQGKLSGSNIEGRHGVSQEDLDHGIKGWPNEGVIGYVSVKHQRSGLAVQYARAAEKAKLRGDTASYNIYSRAAKEHQ